MALPALLGGLARGALMGGGRGIAGAARGGLVKAAKGGLVKTSRGALTKPKGGALVKPKQSMTPSSAIVTTKSTGAGGGGVGGGASFSSPGPKSERSTAIVKSNLSDSSSAIDILRSVKQTADQILEVEVKDLSTDEEELNEKKEQIDDERKLLEAEKRTEEQNKQEEKKQKPSSRRKSNPIVNAAKKTMGGLWDFLTGLLGDFIKYKILDWISNPKNREKITNIVKFIQGLPDLFLSFKEKFIDPWWNFLTTFIGGNFKIFKSFLTVLVDVFTLKFFTNPQEFLDNLLNIPKTLLEVVPDIIDSLLNAVTGGTIRTIGELVDKLFNNPLKGIDFGGIATTLGGVLGDAGNFIKNMAGAAWNFLGKALGGAPAQAATLDAHGITPTVSGTPTAAAGRDMRFGSVKGHSGSVSYGGKQQASLSVNYSPFSAADVKSKNISIISGKGYRASTNSNHKGYDFPAPKGTPLYAYLPGKVLASQYFSGYGHGIEWKDSIYNQKHFFAHMMSPSPLKSGDTFEQGALLGKTGDTGTPGSYHLHWEIGGRGSEVDPGQWVNSHPLPDNKQSTAIAQVTTPPQPQSGQALTQVQRENQMLELSGMSALKTPVVTYSGNNSQSVINESITGSSLGLTLPSSGTWSIYKTNL